MKLLIDGDIYVYRAAAACEQATCWGHIGKPYLWTQHVDIREAISVLERSLDRTISACYPKGKASKIEMVIALSDHGNCFRKDLDSSYKANRSGKKPMGIGPLEEYLKEHYEVHVWDHLEADDVLGIMQTYSEEDTVICSIDKDMKTIPGNHYNPNTGEHSVSTPSEAARFHLYQTLIGDTTDGYPGCPGVGPKTAEKILDPEIDDLWPEVVAAFVKKGLTEEDALLQARMAKILDTTLWTAQEGVKLWEP